MYAQTWWQAVTSGGGTVEEPVAWLPSTVGPFVCADGRTPSSVTSSKPGIDANCLHSIFLWDNLVGVHYGMENELPLPPICLAWFQFAGFVKIPLRVSGKANVICSFTFTVNVKIKVDKARVTCCHTSSQTVENRFRNLTVWTINWLRKAIILRCWIAGTLPQKHFFINSKLPDVS